MQEKYAFEILYDRICEMFGQIPSVFDAFVALPILVQQFVLIVLLLFGIDILTAFVSGVIRFACCWARRH